MTERDIKELEWLRREVALASRLTDEQRILILSDLWETANSIRRTKSPEDIRREEAARRLRHRLGLTRFFRRPAVSAVGWAIPYPHRCG